MNTEEFYNGSPYEVGTMDNLAEIKGIMGVPEHNEVTELRFADNELEENMHVVENIKDMVG